MVHKSSAGITNLPTFIRNKCEVIGTKIVIIFNFHGMFVPILQGADSKCCLGWFL